MLCITTIDIADRESRMDYTIHSILFVISICSHVRTHAAVSIYSSGLVHIYDTYVHRIHVFLVLDAPLTLSDFTYEYIPRQFRSSGIKSLLNHVLWRHGIRVKPEKRHELRPHMVIGSFVCLMQRVAGWSLSMSRCWWVIDLPYGVQELRHNNIRRKNLSHQK